MLLNYFVISLENYSDSVQIWLYECYLETNASLFAAGEEIVLSALCGFLFIFEIQIVSYLTPGSCSIGESDIVYLAALQRSSFC